MEFVSSEGLSSDDQFGFHKGRSTVVSLLWLPVIGISPWRINLKLLAYFFDYNKAFDSVPHQALLNMQVPSLLICWIEDYIYQYVTLNFSVFNLASSPFWSTPGFDSGTFVVFGLDK